MSVLVNSTGGAFKKLVPVARGTGGMAEDALVFKQKAPGFTRQRGRSAALSEAHTADH